MAAGWERRAGGFRTDVPGCSLEISWTANEKSVDFALTRFPCSPRDIYRFRLFFALTKTMRQIILSHWLRTLRLPG